MAGIVSSVHTPLTREGKPFVTAALEDLAGNINVICWPKLYQKTSSLWVEGNSLLIQGKVKTKNEEVQLVCEQVQQCQPEEDKPSEVSPQPASCLLVTLAQTTDTQKDVEQLYKVVDLIREYPGEDKVSLAIITENGTVNMEIPGLTTHSCPELVQQLQQVVPQGTVVEQAS